MINPPHAWRIFEWGHFLLIICFLIDLKILRPPTDHRIFDRPSADTCVIGYL